MRRTLQIALLVGMALLGTPALRPRAEAADQDRPTRALVRPALGPAQVTGCQVSRPGDYELRAGDLFEITYLYPVVPSAMPRRVGLAIPPGDQAAECPNGVLRLARRGLMGTDGYVALVQAKRSGTVRVSLKIDGQAYGYHLTVK